MSKLTEKQKLILRAKNTIKRRERQLLSLHKSWLECMALDTTILGKSEIGMTESEFIKQIIKLESTVEKAEIGNEKQDYIDIKIVKHWTEFLTEVGKPIKLRGIRQLDKLQLIKRKEEELNELVIEFNQEEKEITQLCTTEWSTIEVANAKLKSILP